MDVLDEKFHIMKWFCMLCILKVVFVESDNNIQKMRTEET